MTDVGLYDIEFHLCNLVLRFSSLLEGNFLGQSLGCK